MTPGTNEFVAYHEFVGVAPSLPIRTNITFVRFIGTDGVNGQSIFPIYATNVAGDNQTFTAAADTDFVTFFESATRPTLPVADQVFVRYIGTDGAAGQPGTDGANVLVVYADTNNALTNTQSLTPGTNEFVAYHEYTGAVPTLPIRASIVFVRFVGEDGTAGTAGQSIFPIYATNVAGDSQSFIPAADSRFVTFFEAAVRPTLPVSGQTFVRYVGEDGLTGERVYRFHENVVTDDPGAPTGANGTGGGWYDADATDAPADPNPHWEASTVALRMGGTPRVVTHEFSGVAANVQTQDVPANQILDFTVAGASGTTVGSTGSPASNTLLISGETGLPLVTSPTTAAINISGDTGDIQPGEFPGDQNWGSTGERFTIFREIPSSNLLATTWAEVNTTGGEFEIRRNAAQADPFIPGSTNPTNILLASNNAFQYGADTFGDQTVNNVLDTVGGVLISTNSGPRLTVISTGVRTIFDNIRGININVVAAQLEITSPNTTNVFYFRETRFPGSEFDPTNMAFTYRQGTLGVTLVTLIPREYIPNEALIVDPSDIVVSYGTTSRTLILESMLTTAADIEADFIAKFNADAILRSTWNAAVITNGTIQLSTTLDQDLPDLAFTAVDNDGDITVTSAITQGVTPVPFVASQITLESTDGVTFDETIVLTQALTTPNAIATDFKARFDANTNLQAAFLPAIINTNDSITITRRANGNFPTTVTSRDNGGNVDLLVSTVDGVDGTQNGAPSIVRIALGSTTITRSYNGQSIDSILNDIETQVESIGGANQYSGTLQESGVIRFVSTFTGQTPLLQISVTDIGEVSDGVPATLSISRTLINDGLNRNSIVGQQSVVNMTLGSNTPISLTIQGSDSSTVVANLVLAQLNTSITEYTHVLNGDIITSTLDTNSNMPDLTLTVTPGLNADNSASTLEVMKAITQAGQPFGLDLTDSTWVYFPLSREIRVDDDTTTLMPTGEITVPVGLVVDSESIAADSTQDGNTLRTVESAERHITKNHISDIIVFGATAGLLISSDSGSDVVSFALEASVDNGVTWTRQSPLPTGYAVNRGTGFGNQLFNAASYLAITIQDVPANTSVRFRVVVLGPITHFNGGWGWAASIIEERNNPV